MWTWHYQATWITIKYFLNSLLYIIKNVKNTSHGKSFINNKTHACDFNGESTDIINMSPIHIHPTIQKKSLKPTE